MPRDNRCMYMAHVFFVCCSDCVGMFVVCRPLLKIEGCIGLGSVEVCCVFVKGV